MKAKLLIPTALMLLSLVSCGKKTEEDNGLKTLAPSQAGNYFNSLKEIQRAILANDLPALKRAVYENPLVDLNQTLTDGDTFLITAIRKDLRQIRNYFIERGLNIEKANVNNETPLMVAVKANLENSVQVLVDLKVDLEKKDANGDTALHVALKNSNDMLAAILIKHGSNLETTDRQNQNAIKIAEVKNVPKSFEMIKNILQLEIGTPDIASFRKILGDADLKKLSKTLARFPHIISDYEAINPLAILVTAKDENAAMQAAEILLSRKANVNGPENAEETPLIKSTMLQKQSFAKLYLDANADPQKLDKDGKSALIHAIELNNLQLVELLLRHEAVEKYTLRKNGKKITFSACTTVKETRKNLEDENALEVNSEIKEKLDCGFWSFL